MDREMLTDMYLQQIAKEIGSAWSTLGYILGLSSAELDCLKCENRNSMADCIAKMLVKWRDRSSQSTCVADLRRALEEIHRTDLSETIEEDYKGKLTTP